MQVVEEDTVCLPAYPEKISLESMEHTVDQEEDEHDGSVDMFPTPPQLRNLDDDVVLPPPSGFEDDRQGDPDPLLDVSSDSLPPPPPGLEDGDSQENPQDVSSDYLPPPLPDYQDNPSDVSSDSLPPPPPGLEDGDSQDDTPDVSNSWPPLPTELEDGDHLDNASDIPPDSPPPPELEDGDHQDNTSEVAPDSPPLPPELEDSDHLAPPPPPKLETATQKFISELPPVPPYTVIDLLRDSCPEFLDTIFPEKAPSPAVTSSNWESSDIFDDHRNLDYRSLPPKKPRQPGSPELLLTETAGKIQFEKSS